MSDNIPAFPAFAIGRTLNDEMYELSQSGMTLRDWFAGMALQGWLSTFGDYPMPDDCAPMAQGMYKIADAMMKARGE